MIQTDNLTLAFGGRALFENVNIKFTPGNSYGLIGANGAGKSTFLRCLSGEQEITSGNVSIPKGLRVSTLRQNHFVFNEVRVLDTVLQGFRPKTMPFTKRVDSREHGERCTDHNQIMSRIFFMLYKSVKMQNAKCMLTINTHLSTTILFVGNRRIRSTRLTQSQLY